METANRMPFWGPVRSAHAPPAAVLVDEVAEEAAAALAGKAPLVVEVAGEAAVADDAAQKASGDATD